MFTQSRSQPVPPGKTVSATAGWHPGRRLATATQPPRQITEAVRRFDLGRQAKPFSRCLRCNTLLEQASKDQVRHQLPAQVAQPNCTMSSCAAPIVAASTGKAATSAACGSGGMSACRRRLGPVNCLWQKSPIRQGSADRPCKPLNLKGRFLEIRQSSAVFDFCFGLLRVVSAAIRQTIALG